MFVCILLIGGAAPVVNSLKNNVIYESYSENITKPSQLGDWIQMQKLLPLDGGTYDYFGASVSLDGNTALIGAYGDCDNGQESGSVYVFTRSGINWTLQQKLLASNGSAGDLFGYSVSLDGDTALIGAFGDGDNGQEYGSVYVFTRSDTTWIEQQKLTSPDGLAGDYYFGGSVSLSGDTALIGASGWYDDEGGQNGSAYVFTRNGTNWILQQKLFASDGAFGDGFGCSVSLFGDTALIGAPRPLFDKGSAYVFTRNGTNWTQQGKLFDIYGEIHEGFGWPVSLSNDTALIGTPENVFIFTRTGNTWAQQSKFLISDSSSVSLDGDTAFIGAYNEYTYVFTRSGTHWTEQQKLSASDGENMDYFGISISLEGNTAIIGASGDDDNGLDSGSAYIFTKNQLPNSPKINGSTKIKVGKTCSYTFTSIDPNGDEVSYFIEWGDGTTTNWTDYRPSGSPGYVGNHSWSPKGNYIIHAKAKDIYGAESSWTTLTVTIPKIKEINIQFIKYINNHPYLFLILQKILNRFG